jgi:hypothetical protein
MRVEICKPEQFHKFEEVVRACPQMYGVKLEDFYDSYIQTLHESVNNNNILPIIVFDTDDSVLAVLLVKLLTNVKCSYIQYSFLSRLGYTRYNEIFKYTAPFILSSGAERGYYGLYAVLPVSRNRTLISSYANVVSDYEFMDLEVIEPHALSKNQLVNQFLLGRMAGKNEKRLVLKYCFLKKYREHYLPK